MSRFIAILLMVLGVLGPVSTNLYAAGNADDAEPSPTSQSDSDCD